MSDAIRLHKVLAEGKPYPGSENNFGCQPLSSKAAGGPSGKTDGGTLPDSARSAGPPIKGHQANPNHGYGED